MIIYLDNDCGAIGNGLTDDSNALLLALDVAKSIHNNGVIPTIKLTSGATYKISFKKKQIDTDPFSLQAAKSFYFFHILSWTQLNNGIGPTNRCLNICCDSNATILVDGDENSWFFTSSANGYFTLNLTGVTIKAFDPLKVCHGISVSHLIYSSWNNVSIQDFYNGIALNLIGSEQNTFNLLSLFKNMRSLVLGNPWIIDYSIINCNENRFSNIAIMYNGENLDDYEVDKKGFLEIYYGQSIVFESGTMKSNYSSAIIYAADNLRFSSIYFENNSIGRDQSGTTYGLWNHVVLNAKGSEITGTQAHVSRIKNLVFQSCYMSWRGVLFLASETQQIHGVKFLDTNYVKQNSAGLAYIADQIDYIKKIVFETVLWTNTELTTIMSSYPNQISVDPISYQVISSNSASPILPITIR
jgi:hypothetical protein